MRVCLCLSSSSFSAAEITSVASLYQTQFAPIFTQKWKRKSAKTQKKLPISFKQQHLSFCVQKREKRRES